MSEPIQTLVVDDEAGIRFFVEQTLARVGHVVTTASSGEQALALLRDTPFDLVLLDLKLGGKVDGLRVLEAIRWRWPAAVVIIITAHGSLESAMAAIREGVDRYLLKPVTPKALRAAVEEALAQRSARAGQTPSAAPAEVLRRGPVAVDLQKHAVSVEDRPVTLTPSEFNLLVHLMRNAHRVVPPPELVEVVRDYRPDTMHEARSVIKWYVHRLRQKLEADPAHPAHILNVRGVGYRFAHPG